MEELDERQLIIAYLQGGKREALDFLIKIYLKPVYNFILRLLGSIKDAEDLTQETFLKMWKNLKRFDQTKDFKPWLYQIAKNTCLDYFKRKKEIVFSELSLADNEIFTGEEMAEFNYSFLNESIDQEIKAEQINKALEELPVIYRVVLILYYYQQLNFREISEILEESLNTIKSRHRRAVIMLKKRLSAPN